jgi:hypothetical protein
MFSAYHDFNDYPTYTGLAYLGDLDCEGIRKQWQRRMRNS